MTYISLQTAAKLLNCSPRDVERAILNDEVIGVPLEDGGYAIPLEPLIASISYVRPGGALSYAWGAIAAHRAFKTREEVKSKRVPTSTRLIPQKATFTVSEVSALLGVTTKTTRKLIKSGVIPGFWLGSRLMVRRSTLVRVLYNDICRRRLTSGPTLAYRVHERALAHALREELERSSGATAPQAPPD